VHRRNSRSRTIELDVRDGRRHERVRGIPRPGLLCHLAVRGRILSHGARARASGRAARSRALPFAARRSALAIESALPFQYAQQHLGAHASRCRRRRRDVVPPRGDAARGIRCGLGARGAAARRVGRPALLPRNHASAVRRPASHGGRCRREPTPGAGAELLTSAARREHRAARRGRVAGDDRRPDNGARGRPNTTNPRGRHRPRVAAGRRAARRNWPEHHAPIPRRLGLVAGAQVPA